MSNEVKFVHREETFNDHAVEEIAEARARCICRLQFGRCKKKECAACSNHKHFVDCYSNMNSYDRLRVDKNVSEKYGMYSQYPESFMGYKQIKKFNFKMVAAMFACFLLCLLFCVLGNARCYETSAEFDRKVEKVLKQVNENCYDVNKDGKINCIDHAVLFKVYWDKQFDKEDCQIVRNFNPEKGLHHLFVQVWDHGWCRMVAIEPWIDGGDYSHKYRCMDCVWGDTYDHFRNRYGETKYWLFRGGF